MKTIKIVGVILGLLVLILAGLAVKTLRDAGEFKDLAWHGPENCLAVGGLSGSEDITVDRRTGRVYVSSVDFRALTQSKAAPRGGVFAWDLQSPQSAPVDLTKDFPRDFYPHGLGLLTAPDRPARLFVVNHHPAGPCVEIFDDAGDRLVHVRTITGPELISPNDLIPVGPEEFYVTNDHGSSGSWGRALEDYLQLSRANLLYYDGTSFREAAGGFSYPNGVNVSPDGRTLYLAETLGRKLRIFDRDISSGGLTLRRTLELDTGLDNLDVAENGEVYIGAHPRMLTFTKYAADPERLSPAQVLRVSPTPSGDFRVEEIYLQDGRDLSGSSVAVFFQDRLLIGSVFDDRFLVCEFK